MLPFLEIKQNVVYGKKQQSTIEDRCQKTAETSKVELVGIQNKLKEILGKIRIEITDDDLEFEERVKDNKV